MRRVLRRFMPRARVGVDVFVVCRADDEGLAPHPRHEGSPRGLARPGPSEVLERGGRTLTETDPGIIRQPPRRSRRGRILAPPLRLRTPGYGAVVALEMLELPKLDGQ